MAGPPGGCAGGSRRKGRTGDPGARGGGGRGQPRRPVAAAGRPDGRGLFLPRELAAMNGNSWRLIIGAAGVLVVLSLLI